MPFDKNDWIKASKYTDDTVANNVQIQVSGRNILIETGAIYTSDDGNAEYYNHGIKIAGDNVDKGGYGRYDLRKNSSPTSALFDNNQTSLATSGSKVITFESAVDADEYLLLYIEGIDSYDYYIKYPIAFKIIKGLTYTLSFESVYSTEVKELYISNIKLETGSEAKVWTPAHEDISTDIAEAAATATNFMDFIDGEGLVVGDMSSESLGKNTLIDSDGFAVRDGSTEVARFGKDLVSLAQNGFYIERDNSTGHTMVYSGGIPESDDNEMSFMVEPQLDIGISDNTQIIQITTAETIIGNSASKDSVSIGSDGITINNESGAIATFSKDLINIGKWNKDSKEGDRAQINFYNGSAYIEFEVRGTRDLLSLNSGGLRFFGYDQPYFAYSISGGRSGVMDDWITSCDSTGGYSGPMLKFASGLQIKFGSLTINTEPPSTYDTLVNITNFFPQATYNTVYVNCVNGDYNASANVIAGVAVSPDGTVTLNWRSKPSTPRRINFMYVYFPSSTLT